jgi:hypothetical protein
LITKPKKPSVSSATPDIDVGEKVEKKTLATGLSYNAVIVSVFSGLAYLIAFNYERAYLGYFGGDYHFVEISVERTVFVFSLILTILYALYSIFGLLVVMLWSTKIRIVVRTFIVETVLLVIVICFYHWIGVSWLTVTLVSIFFLLLLNHLIGVVRTLLKGRPWKEWFSDWHAGLRQKPSERRDLDDILIDRIGYGPWAVMVAVVILLPNVGTLAGHYIAGNSRVFSSFTESGSVFVVIGMKNDFLVLAEVVGDKATGQILLKKIDPSNPLKIDRTVYTNGIEGIEGRIHKTTFGEFWSNLNLSFAFRKQMRVNHTTMGPH